jgi:hypothetical protein
VRAAVTNCAVLTHCRQEHSRFGNGIPESKRRTTSARNLPVPDSSDRHQWQGSEMHKNRLEKEFVVDHRETTRGLKALQDALTAK